MKTLVSIPEEVEDMIENYRKTNYPDLTIPKMLVRVILDQIRKDAKNDN